MVRELFVKLSSLSHSSFGRIFFFLKSHAIFAPVGYPLIKPIINAKAPSPSTLNIGLINTLKKFPIIYGILVLESNSVATKKGNKDGTIEVAHKVSPDFVEDILDVANKTKLIVKRIIAE